MLGSAFRQHRPRDTRPRLLIAGAGGILGGEITNQLLASQAYQQTTVLSSEPFSTSLRGLQTLVVGPDGPEGIPSVEADVGVVMFEPGRAFYERERALWTPTPGHLLPVAKWMLRCGVGTLLVVLPHQPNRLPTALQRGLANLDEVAVCALGIQRLVIIRSASKLAPTASDLPWGAKIASWMLNALSYMVPNSEQPLRASQLARIVGQTLAEVQASPGGTFIAGHELLYQALHGETDQVIRQWLLPSERQ
jgi:hypothetical protein